MGKKIVIAGAGHGGKLDDKLREYVMNKTAQKGAIPAGVPKRFKPSPSQMIEKIQADLRKDRGRYGIQYYDIAKEDYMKKIACAMYCKKLQQEAYQNGGGSPELDPEKMNRTVNRLMSSNTFRAMFRNPGDTYRMADCIANQRMSELFNQLSSHNGRMEMEQPQPVVQNQPIQNQVNNQPVQNLGQNQQNLNQQNLNQAQNQAQNQVNNQQNQNLGQNQQLNNQLLQNLQQQGLFINQQGQLVNRQGQPVNMQGQPIQAQGQAANGQNQPGIQQQGNNNGRRRGGSVHQPAPQQIHI